MLGDLLGCTNGKILGIKLGFSDGIVLGAILVNVDGIKLGLDNETELGSLDGLFYGYNDNKSEVLLIGGSLWSTYGEEIGSDEGIKLGLFHCNVNEAILLNVYGITLGLNVWTEMCSWDG